MRRFFVSCCVFKANGRVNWDWFFLFASVSKTVCVVDVGVREIIRETESKIKIESILCICVFNGNVNSARVDEHFVEQTVES